MFENTYLCRIQSQKRPLGYNFMLPGNFQFDLYNRSTLQSGKYDDFSVVRNYGKFSAKCLLGILLVIEVGLLSYFLFLARTTARIRLNRRLLLKYRLQFLIVFLF